ncbi:phosphoribosylanthranilate isomerase [Afifella sp. YEN Y35]|uniref:phosphoribosylanthranilate isomerase n=1 Tax=Afifella sp. YEN Y35 TaxID=3388337 RepID=UPI0039DF690A
MLDKTWDSCDWKAMKTEVKICGLTKPEDIDAALAAGADWIGFVFFAKSPRSLSVARAAELAAPARGRVGIVALTVDAQDDLIEEIARDLKPDFIQLHGSETPERATEIRSRFGLRAVKALGVGERADLDRASLYAGHVERLLLDARPPKGATRPGGNGASFDWRLLEDFAPGMPWFLSGGLNGDNIGAALAATRASAVDVSSGVERAPGEKDPAEIVRFVAAVRAHDARRGDAKDARPAAKAAPVAAA